MKVLSRYQKRELFWKVLLIESYIDEFPYITREQLRACRTPQDMQRLCGR